MLVTRLRNLIDRASGGARHDDSGSALVSVIVVMLVLTVVAVTAATVVTGTSSSVVDTRGGVQARAAADAGISAALAEARRSSAFCSLTLLSSSPDYSVTSDCAASKVTFTSTGRGEDGGEIVTQAVYSYTVTASFTGAAELVFFNESGDKVYFTNRVMPKSSGTTTIDFPAGGGFECKTEVPGDVRIKGSFKGQSGCTIKGNLHVGGLNPISGWATYLNNSDVVEGNLISGGSTSVGGSISKVGGTLTLPQNATLQINWSNVTNSKPTSNAKVASGAANGIRWQSSVAAPVFAPWFDYQLKVDDWPGYDRVILTDTSTPYSCKNIEGSSTTFWNTYVTNLTRNTVVDATRCDDIDTDQGADANAQLGVNLVIVAPKFKLGKLTITPKTGTDPQAWLIVPDPIADGQPSCNVDVGPGLKDSDKIETDAYVNMRVRTMMYTPCQIDIGNGGVFTGSMYSGDLDDGGEISIHARSMALPGQWGSGSGGSGATGGGSPILGALISQRDIS